MIVSEKEGLAMGSSFANDIILILEKGGNYTYILVNSGSENMLASVSEC